MSSEDSEGLLNRLFNDYSNLSKFSCNGQLLVNFTYSQTKLKYSMSLCEMMTDVKRVNIGDMVNGHIYHRAQSGIMEFTGLKPIEFIVNEEVNKFTYKDYFHVSLNGMIKNVAKYPSFLKKEPDNSFGIKLVS